MCLIFADRIPYSDLLIRTSLEAAGALRPISLQTTDGEAFAHQDWRASGGFKRWTMALAWTRLRTLSLARTRET